ncbi:LysM peptidoglycan-binding domain-containing protein [Neobacillus ginsengisoli]|uniref:LysM repeat protein n=1 Tax=Neobacillus ginsengisoli TaxID=904295 RepID=A0ABT9XNF2_9BACI|nr:LysM domain-containing protein [Neobacillus ginsengisoli]MDQ0197075.1 LysM repeat protein [Neobacillus ginsengisoli]
MGPKDDGIKRNGNKFSENEKEFLINIENFIDSIKKEFDFFILVNENNYEALNKPDSFIKMIAPMNNKKIDTLELYLDSEVIKLVEVLELLNAVNYIYHKATRALGFNPSDFPLELTKIEKGSLIVWLRGKKDAIMLTATIIQAILAGATFGYELWKDHYKQNAPMVQCSVPTEVFIKGKKLSDNFNMEYECNTSEKTNTIKFKVSSKEVVNKNDIKTYTVREGDTLSSIAIEQNIDLNTLLQDNNLKLGDIIMPGQKLKINKK